MVRIYWSVTRYFAEIEEVMFEELMCEEVMFEEVMFEEVMYIYYC